MSIETENNTKTKKMMKDMTSLGDLEDLNPIRGETPVDIRERCLQLCRDYLSGNWRQQTVDTIDVRRVSGGMTNQMYYCGITCPSKEHQSVGVPQEVAVRLYGPKYFNNSDCDGNERLTDVIVSVMVSQNNLGPKVYALFDGGQIQAYYKVCMYFIPKCFYNCIVYQVEIKVLTYFISLLNCI